MKISFFVLLLLVVDYSFTYKSSGDRFFYKKRINGIEVLILKNNNTFENYFEGNRSKDFSAIYSQGIFTEQGNSVGFKNSFIDSIKLIVREKVMSEKEYNLYKYTRVVYKDTKEKMMDISFINYDRGNDGENQDNIYLCVVDKNGIKRYKQYNFEKGSFGDIYYENMPVSFYLKIGDDIVSQVYSIKNPEANYFEISLNLDERNYIYHHRVNYLYGTAYQLHGEFLINSASSDTFRLYNRNFEAKDIRSITNEIIQNIK